ncbi:cysteine hydrolase [Mesorhizobium sp. M2D.F.Ca.ET.185.01.1.1]|uniref:cysteine hydrolase family protein n=1 Tax=unclassified Mesorhizobium TaxID=325217 RepID=UPI000FCB0067|nr:MULTISPECIES: isochorismatase family cysteine hydrolase [unclassified Mesorhizobium]TGP83169.1 cysteine hydrolase [bacterium M00.F.Ca.ET.227.01.1.1]TGP99125.1 cysteine hydrolase [bacterium M00.F.Ca.ET.221.01.1.1]TGP99855.1 cysteine hydrolase [bacterium M00.F.Ca.ET.222.01.1.1]TGU05619.1 cysteine hydrolase [bacterium M00.F.Ca.ET.163.01.1.1]TGU25413.1 cysteine hydrolase [bacterium M00.F.Ca.ET.156.01.1.1]TGU51184.1 cysteine hydrolase [bacterium M00.F.Ca.ET.146.01.1.1]TGV71253.1 cysteine hydro
MAEIAAQPFAFAFKPQTTALIVIDMQRDFAETGGFGASLGNDVSRVTAIVPTVKRLIEGFRAAGLPVIHTMECHRPDLSDLPPAKRDRGNPSIRIGDVGPMGRVLIAGEPGTAIVEELAPLPGEIVIEKPGKGAFYATGLGDDLKRLGARQLVFAGVTTEVCVQTTMREANDRGYECLVAEDATESYFPEFKAAALAMIRAQGAIVGWTATTDQVLEGIANA